VTYHHIRYVNLLYRNFECKLFAACVTELLLVQFEIISRGINLCPPPPYMSGTIGRGEKLILKVWFSKNSKVGTIPLRIWH